MATGRVPTTANSPLTAKGDLFGYSTTQARVPVGNDGETIVADSSTATGLRYQVPVNFNPVLNSAMQVWQRGTSVAIAAAATVYSADRWMISASASNALTIARQSTNDTTNLPFIQYCMRFQRNSGQTGTGALNLSQSMETINSVPFAGKVVTFSFYARSGANYSATSSALGVQLYTGTGTDQNIAGSGYTGFATPINSSATLTTTWQRFTYTGTIASTVTEIAPYFTFTPTGTAGANDWFEITGLQLEVGSVATPFKTYAGTIQGELAACQRYYMRFGSPNITNINETFGTGNGLTTTSANIVLPFPVQMRVAPTAVDFSTLRVTDMVLQGDAVTSVTLSSTENGRNAGKVQAAISPANLTVNRMYFISANASTNGFIGFSAEL